jgi:hypothetical protein
VSNDVETLRMWLAIERPTALLVMDAELNAARRWWLPRSLIPRLTKSPKTDPLGYQPVEFTLPAWKVREAGLDEFITS